MARSRGTDFRRFGGGLRDRGSWAVEHRLTGGDVTAGITSGPGHAAQRRCWRPRASPCALHTRAPPGRQRSRRVTAAGTGWAAWGERKHACRSSELPVCLQPPSGHRAYRELSADSVDGSGLAP
ncbi:hypothetical protein R6Z07F_009798 [Ovis aries]